MELMKLINIIMPRLTKLFEKVNDDKLISISIDPAYDNALLLTFTTYDFDDTYEMRAIIGRDRIIYENAVNGMDFRDYVFEHGLTEEEYDEIMGGITDEV